eukprot:gnl/TRDRNA2_/TRDRNA2_179867_c0_seq1.p1 gnl/TRDRNA2_/TRDRNA2_179867_c0~~gnl/TRDRNA2_/TRDRNA2_179867_c0_seq1.p1  ORF type:complete len:222 (-),score=33.72 gnl/TRDRNA2_/TRDRNA2_179867_c0_seq1:90-755(-)
MVLLPGPAVPVLSGPPSTYALRMRPYLLGTMGLLLVVAAARFLVGDFPGGLFLVLSSTIGVFAVRNGMDVSYLLCLAVVLFLNAVFDAFILAARAAHVQQPIFGSKVTTTMNAVHGTLFAGPIVEMAGAIICWSIFKEHINHLRSELDPFDEAIAAGGAIGVGGNNNARAMQQPIVGTGYGAAMGAEGLTGASSQMRRSLPCPGPNANFQAFQGTGHRLSV